MSRPSKSLPSSDARDGLLAERVSDALVDEAIQREVDALVRLLDDPDADVQEQVQTRLNALGRDAMPALRRAYDASSREQREQIDAVVRRLHWNDVKTAWHAILTSDEPNLERGAFILALYRFPNLDVEAYQETLDEWADRIEPEVMQTTGVDRARVMVEFLAEEIGLTGNRSEYDDPNNSYLNRVIDRRMGIPISLSVIAIGVADRLGIPMYGVGMPAHFLVKYSDARGEVYFDLFHDGQPVSREECVRFLLRSGIQPKPEYFQASDSTSILLRMVRNLRHVARGSGNRQMYEELTELAAPYDASISEDDMTLDEPDESGDDPGGAPYGGDDNDPMGFL
jgi:regulator of sirC expression with transglutaminase-like and TPR domain